MFIKCTGSNANSLILKSETRILLWFWESYCLTFQSEGISLYWSLKCMNELLLIFSRIFFTFIDHVQKLILISMSLESSYLLQNDHLEAIVKHSGLKAISFIEASSAWLFRRAGFTFIDHVNVSDYGMQVNWSCGGASFLLGMRGIVLPRIMTRGSRLELDDMVCGELKPLWSVCTFL